MRDRPRVLARSAAATRAARSPLIYAMHSILTCLRQSPTAPVLLLMTMMTLAAGCSGAAVMRPRPERLVEVPLGAFRIPLAPQSHRQSDSELAERNRLVLRFKLCALVPPEREENVLRRIESHEVRLRDEVIHACRAASVVELSDPALGALTARLTKAVAKHVGPGHVRRVVISKVLLEPT
jgi:hypothetical protein